MEDWITLEEESDLIKANVMNAALHAENIDTVFLSRKDQAFNFLGVYEIKVRKEDEDRARVVIDEIDDRDYVAEHSED